MTVLKRRKIFILDDEKSMEDLYKELFDEYDYDVDIYNDYESAKKAINENGVDNWGLYIIDLKVPLTKNLDDKCELNCFYGFYLAEECIPMKKIIFVSGYVSPEINKIIMKTRPLMSFNKPFSLIQLITLINAMFEYYI